MSRTADPLELPSDADASGRSFGAEEIELLRQVIEGGVLTSTRGTMTPQLEAEFATFVGVAHCRAVASGTAAVHLAVAAIDPRPGDEIITTPITDMGAITPILYQAAIPVFADVDPRTYNVTAEAIARKITARTRAVIVTHLFGLPAEMEAICELCRERGIALIEDCAQAFGATYDDCHVGRFGDIGCFSLQQGKHMSAGEGGLVVTDDAALARRMRLFSDKAWGYGDAEPDHYFLALNYRLSELQAAVALAQLRKLPKMLAQRQRMAQRLDRLLVDLPGIRCPARGERSNHVYWKYSLDVDPAIVPGGTVELGTRLRQAGIYCSPRYVQKPAYECQVLRQRRTFGDSSFPFEGPHREGCDPVIYDAADTPGAVEALDRVLVLPLNERYEERHIDSLATHVRQAVEQLVGAARLVRG